MMIKLVLLLAIAIQVYCDEPEAIVGGNIAMKGQFQYQVSLQIYGEHICGGSIISSRHILTAAHCVDDEYYRNGMEVVSGTITSNGEKHQVKCIRMHPDYTGESKQGWKNDIALITLKEPIKWNDVQSPIPLASKNHIEGGKRGTISGWGKTETNGLTSPILRWLEVNVLSQEKCLSGHKNPPTNENQICTLEKVGKGACHGDSGGPLVVDDELVGVLSWVFPCAMRISDVFINVYKYRDFIEEFQSKC